LSLESFVGGAIIRSAVGNPRYFIIATPASFQVAVLVA
jgi:hypothetical protein